eukprot:scaffold1231_cov187-Pinguiococcus_pyrenoidosus.AAC.2
MEPISTNVCPCTSVLNIDTSRIFILSLRRCSVLDDSPTVRNTATPPVHLASSCPAPAIHSLLSGFRWQQTRRCVGRLHNDQRRKTRGADPFWSAERAMRKAEGNGSQTQSGARLSERMLQTLALCERRGGAAQRAMHTMSSCFDLLDGLTHEHFCSRQRREAEECSRCKRRRHLRRT